jgi:dCTP deaminase
MTIASTDLLIFEAAERIARLLSHVQLSRRIASRHATRLGAQDNAAESVEATLLKAFDLLRRVAWKTSAAPSDVTGALIDIMFTVSALHVSLLQYIPRPYEPVELLSFLRQATEHTNPGSNFQIFASEQLYNSCFVHDPIGRLSTNLEDHLSWVNQSDENILDFRIRRLEEERRPFTEHAPGYISIPRVDLNNPCCWPSLIHELAHQSGPDQGKQLNDQLKQYLSAGAYRSLLVSARMWMGRSEMGDIETEGHLSQWLLECSCDAAGIRALGPAIWFSQLQAFLFTVNRYLSQVVPIQVDSRYSYPPAHFRLRVLLKLLKTRYQIGDNEVRNRLFKAMAEQQGILLGVFCTGLDASITSTACAHVFGVIAEFLSTTIPSGANKANENVSFEDLIAMEEAIDQGEPIPTTGRDPLKDRKSSIGEILLAGWFSRNSKHRDKIIEIVRDASYESSSSALIEVQRRVDRFDESLKRSIQVAEWINVLRKPADVSAAVEAISTTSSSERITVQGVLNCDEIERCLQNLELRIVPLINPELQISATSVDVRLGHNFEVFFPNVHGEVDSVSAVDTAGSTSKLPDSMDVQIDFLDGITVNPGQFILAHTLEYIRLPRNIAAQIEGRSSFARLGIQVHMTANLVESGFEGSLTLEIANIGPSAVKLYPGMRIGQLRFFGLSPSARESDGIAPKYHGLLSQNKTRQGSDPEVAVLRKQLVARNLLGNPISSTVQLGDSP